MSDFIDLCLDEGMKPPDEYYEVIETTETGGYSVVSECDPEACVHAAGHAVANYVLGRHVESVRGFPEDDFDEWCTGMVTLAVEPEPRDDAERLALYRRWMVALMAGGYALHLYTGVEPKDGMSFSDQAAVYGSLISTYMDIAGYPAPPFEVPDDPAEPFDERILEWCEEQDAALERELWAEVGRILKGNWDLVEGLAAVLTEYPILFGEEVYEIFGRIEARRVAP